MADRVRGQARKTAAQAAPLARTAGDAVKQGAAQAGPLARTATDAVKQGAAQAAPLARTAGDAVRQSADDVAAWAAPQVRKTREWAAPRVERTGIAVQEKIAPQVSATLTKAARRLDPAPAKRRSRIGRIFTILAAAAGVAAAVAVIRKRMAADSALPDLDDTADTDVDGTYGSAPVDQGITAEGHGATDEGTEVDPTRVDANGHVPTTP